MFALAVFALTVTSEGALSSALGMTGRVGIVEVEGQISESRTIVDALKGFGRSPVIKAVVVRIESPGGGVAPSQEIYNAIRKLHEEKPVIASLGGLAASGGYYIASACDTIVANPGTLTGSIGVIMQLGNVQELLQKIGVQAEVLKAGEHKDMGSPVRPMTDAERGLFQQMLDSVHAQFISAVAAGRQMDESKVRELADGRVFSGEQARAVGLVDTLGGLEDAITMAAERGGIAGEPRVSRAQLSREPWWWSMIFGSTSSEWLPIRPAVGLQLIYSGLMLR
jgi:protease-4